MKRQVFAPNGGIRIETGRDWCGRYYICWQPGVSVFVRTRKEVLRFMGWPTKTPTGDALRAWLDELEAPAPQAPEPAPALSEELLATGFGPEVFLDEADPNYQCKTIT